MQSSYIPKRTRVQPLTLEEAVEKKASSLKKGRESFRLKFRKPKEMA